MDEITITSADAPEGTIWLVKLVVHAGFAASNGEARRLIQQGGVKINGEAIKEPSFEWTVEDGATLQVGKRKFGQIKLS